LVEVTLAIAFAATSWKKNYNAAAVLEWCIAFIFTFYVFSFFVDLLPALDTKGSGFGDAETRMEQEENDNLAVERRTMSDVRYMEHAHLRQKNEVLP
jgi:hypothetical protein